MDDLLQAREKDETEFKEELRAPGIVTEQEKDAYTIADYAGLAMNSFIYCPDDLDYFRANKELVEIIETTQTGRGAKKIRLTPELFEYWLRGSIKDGIVCLKENYWIPIKGVQTPQIVNPDFEDKAVDWLKNEVYARTSKGNECILLEKVRVWTEQDRRVTLEYISQIK